MKRITISLLFEETTTDDTISLIKKDIISLLYNNSFGLYYQILSMSESGIGDDDKGDFMSNTELETHA